MPVRIATFNLKDFFLPRGEHERSVVAAKVANIAKNLRRADADVVALQEVGEPEMLDRLVSGELADLGYGTPVLGTADKRGIRCAILSRLPVQWSQVHAPQTLAFPRFVESDPEPFPARIPLRRGVVHVRVEAGALGEIDVITAHFKSNRGVPLKNADGLEVPARTPRGRGEGAVRSLVQRAAEALFVRGLVDDVLAASPDHAVCVLGDLNDQSDSFPVRILRADGDPGRGRLRACADLAPAERRFSCFHGGGETLIDHVLVSERLFGALRAHAIFNEDLRYHGPYQEETVFSEDSDHALCVATFEA